jgi:hypothetical protein
VAHAEALTPALRPPAQAYQRVAANPEAAKAAAEAAAKSGSLLRKKMHEKEALQIMNFPDRPSAAELQQRFDTYFAANDPAKGGSYYMQSKVYRAREAIAHAMGLGSSMPPPPHAGSVRCFCCCCLARTAES